MIRQHGYRALVLFSAWTVAGLFFTTQTRIAFGYGRRPISWGQALRLALAEAWIWAALTPAILWIAARIRFERRRWMVALPAHLLLSVIFAVVHMQLWTALAAPFAFTADRPFSSADLARTVTSFKPHMSVLTYWVIVGLSHGFRYYQESRTRALRAVQLEARLAQAQLEVLKMQLHPHFLFNTLHSISTLMHRDVEAADTMMAHLSDLLRVALDNSGIQEVSLKREMEFLDRYLAIEKVRFPDRLRISTSIDPGVLDALLPNLLLQPLVENAVRYSIAPRAAGGEIVVRAGRQNGWLLIEVEDDGPGLSEGWQEGVGLSNTRARLEHLYGKEHRFDLQRGGLGGLLARVEVPYRS